MRSTFATRLTPARRDAVTAAAGTLLVAGVFTDGWAHFNRPGLETFFTPWHAALYSALAINTAWLVLVAVIAGQGRPTARSIPRGYGVALVGAGLFAVGGLADMVWHRLFGIEVAIDALVSPTHLLLGAGGLLILSTVLRAQGVLSDQQGAWTWPARLSLVLTLAVLVSSSCT